MKQTRNTSSTQKRIVKEKDSLLEILWKFPIIQLACEKSGISRATYYRWCEDDDVFSEDAQSQLQKGKALVNDMAESNILLWIKNADMRASMYWLNNNKSWYSNRPIQQNITFQTDWATRKKIEDILKTLSHGK